MVSAISQGWDALRVHCAALGKGAPDNLPQWSCRGVIDDVRVQALVEASDEGMVDLLVQVPADTRWPLARRVFLKLMHATPIIPPGTGIDALLQSWAAVESSGTLDGLTVRSVPDATWLSLSVVRDRNGPRQSNSRVSSGRQLHRV